MILSCNLGIQSELEYLDPQEEHHALFALI